ncbi:MAG: cobaltochelatase subunit CobN, partial [Rhizobiales bacterium]|nr:cobaltochelatase subunit CobN [Hyphomicrobiales bacterium]
MHLLAGEAGRIEDGASAIDLDQPPGDIVFLSAADSELAALARAAAAHGGPTLRLANLARLTHPLSVDLYIEKTLRHARLIVVRMMGGAGYWPYGLERLRALARAGGPALVIVPGDAQWDTALEAFTTIDGEAARRLWRYLVEGGTRNIDHAFAFMAYLVGRGALPPAPEVLPRAGYYRPGRGPVAFRDLDLDSGRPVAAIVFYRALLDGASHAPIDALAEALQAEGIAALPIFVASLKDRESEGFLADAFERTPPAIVLNTTSFAVSKLGAAHDGTVLDLPGKPVLQVILAGSSEEAWRAGSRGLLPRDLTMNVVLPEVDGRLITRAVSFKAEVAEGGFTATVYRPVADRVAFVAAQAAAWVRLAAKRPAERRVAIVLSNYPDRVGRIANGVGLDTPASAVRIAAAMAGAGYAVGDFPDSSAALMLLLTSAAAITSPRWGE